MKTLAMCIGSALFCFVAACGGDDSSTGSGDSQAQATSPTKSDNSTPTGSSNACCSNGSYYACPADDCVAMLEHQSSSCQPDPSRDSSCSQ